MSAAPDPWDALVSGPYHASTTVEVPLPTLAALSELARCAGAPVHDTFRALVARDLLGVADLRDRAVLLHGATGVRRGGGKYLLRINEAMFDLLRRRVAALAVAQAVYLCAVIERAARQLRSVVDICADDRV